jgi:AraC-like DNA-binding protein
MPADCRPRRTGGIPDSLNERVHTFQDADVLSGQRAFLSISCADFYRGLRVVSGWLNLFIPLFRSPSFPTVFKIPMSSRKKAQEFGVAEARRLFSESKTSEFIDVIRIVLTRVDGWPTLNQMADLADVSVRTLQRRMAADGQSYVRLLDQSRAELAVELLSKTEMTFAGVAKETGYTEPQNFIRAFKRWTGQTPQQFRRGLTE